MADLIPRDAGTPFDPVADPAQQRELDEFGCPPDTSILFEDLFFQNEGSRALRMFDPNLIEGLELPAPVPDPDGVLPPPEPVFFPTPDRVDPDTLVDHRGLHDLALAVPGGPNVVVWSFRDNLSGAATWPAPTIRVREGRVVHSTMSNRRGPHTIHHHGIEPTPANDGVGHLTFDVGGLFYSYQWVPTEAGTFFYHCHVNTTLHFEMGMYGLLIVDPDEGAAPFQDGGPGVTLVGNTPTPYGREALWVADDIDTNWHANAVHGHSPDAGISCGEFMAIDDPRRVIDLHDFNPDVFVVSGVPAPWVGGQTVDNAPILLNAAQGSVVSPLVPRGQNLIIRTLNASYTTTRWTFPEELRSRARVTAIDGRTLGRGHFGRYSSSFFLSELPTPYFHLTTAQRWDILLDTSTLPIGASYDVELAYHHWITDEVITRVRTRITIGEPQL